MRLQTWTRTQAAFLALSGLVFGHAAWGQNNAVPFVNQPLVPSAVRPGGLGFTLTINGTGFAPGSIANWNGAALDTSFVSAAQLIARVPTADVATSGTASITVTNPAPGGGTSVAAFLQVTNPESTVNFAQAEFGGGLLPIAVVVGDFNEDGNLDLAALDVSCGDRCSTGGTVAIVLGNGDGTFQPPVRYGAPLGGGSIFTGDFNGDGHLDLAVTGSNDPNGLGILLGNGDGTFQLQVKYYTSRYAYSLAAGDVNHDGALDLIVGEPNYDRPSKQGEVFSGKGDGTFQNVADYWQPKQSGALALGDFNGDGELDLVTPSNYHSTVWVMPGNGNGTFQHGTPYPSGTSPFALITADFNQDGILDLAVLDNYTGNVSIQLGTGDGKFQEPATYATDLSAIVVGDFNGDGKLDIAGLGISLSLLLGNGDGSFQSPVNYTVPAFAQGIAAGDFNNDGRLDLAIADEENNAVDILLQSGVEQPGKP